MEKRKVIKTIERSCRSGKILSACWTCDWGCMAGDIHNNTITFSYIHHHKISTIHKWYLIILLHTHTFITTKYQCMGDFDTFTHKISTIFTVSRQTDGYTWWLVHLKKFFFAFRPVVGFPVKQPITSAESPVFTITNHKGKHQIKIR